MITTKIRKIKKSWQGKCVKEDTKTWYYDLKIKETIERNNIEME